MSQIKQLLKNKYFYLGLLVLFIGIFLNQLASWTLSDKELPVVNDLILDHVPYYKIQWVYDLIPVTAIILFIIYAYKYEINKTPYFLLLFGILQIIRAGFIILTPLASPCLEESLRLFNSRAFTNGLFPSGHSGATFLCFLLAKKYKLILLILSISIVVTLLLARGHYSIDIFAAVLFAYAVYSYGEKHFEKWKNGKNINPEE